MNIKLHTPKSMKTGSGMGSLKQFLLSLLATSVSIALTFGTAAIIDNRAKQKAKREIVMMVMYDMYASLESVEACDSNLMKAMEIQLEIAKDSTLFDKYWGELTVLGTPQVDFTETTERIFSSSIETINTVGNVLFTENVASFYRDRSNYKTSVCDSMLAQVIKDNAYLNYEKTVNMGYKYYVIVSHSLAINMRRNFAQCQQMMKVSDEELKAYQKKREQMDSEMRNEEYLMWIKKINKLQQDIDKAKAGK